jgi:hypothetical protein
VIGGTPVRVFLLVALLSYSRRLFVKAFLSERQDDWREGIAAAFIHFGGITATVLCDNARALVIGRDRAIGTVHFRPAYLALSGLGRAAARVLTLSRPQKRVIIYFANRWLVKYIITKKGKTESGVKYVKRKAVAALSFASFSALEQHLEAWMIVADQRVHGTTHEAPHDRFVRAEASALRRLRRARCVRGRRNGAVQRAVSIGARSR